MGPASRGSWIPVALFVGAFYLVAGLVFGELARRAPTHAMLVASRLAAWVVSGIAYAAQIVYGHARLRASVRAIALHASLAVALGAFGLAVAANVHSLTVADRSHAGRLYLALIAWPVLAGLPSFVVALVLAAVLARLWPRARP